MPLMRISQNLLGRNIQLQVDMTTDGRRNGRATGLTANQTWLTLKNAVPVRLNQLGQDDVNNCLACVARLAHLAQSQ